MKTPTDEELDIEFDALVAEAKEDLDSQKWDEYDDEIMDRLLKLSK